jgi:hypothetical protein
MQQDEQWRALDAISESIEKILKGGSPTGSSEFAHAHPSGPTSDQDGFEFEDEKP